MRYALKGRRPRAALLAAACVLWLAPTVLARGPETQFVQLRIQGPDDQALIEMPAQLLQFVADHSKGDLDVGTIGGRKTAFPMGDLMKIVRENGARDHEVLFFSAPDERGRTQNLYVKTFTRKAARTTGKPTALVFTVKKDGKETVSLRISADTLDSWAKDFGGADDQSPDDFGPFVRACLASAREMGPGPILRIQGRDGELVFALQ